MWLLLDLGNTRLKWAFASADGALSTMRALVHSNNPSCWGALLADLADRNVEQIALSSVAGARAQTLRDVLRGLYPKLAILEAQSVKFCAGVTNGYDAYETLGVDRFLALLGAYKMDAGTQMIAMLGTAMTIDVLHPGGKHAGGLIAPGPSLMQTSLHRGTANLPLVSGHAHVIAQNTADAIYSGCHQACAALIQSVLQEFSGAQLIVSGGAAPAIVPLLSCPVLRVPDLVLQGLLRFCFAAEPGH